MSSNLACTIPQFSLEQCHQNHGQRIEAGIFCRDIVIELTPMATLDDVLSKYRTHPEFLGVKLTRTDQRGAVDDTPLHIAARKRDLEDIAA